MRSVEYSLEGGLVDEFLQQSEWMNFPLMLLGQTTHCSSWQFQPISVYFRVFYALPHEKVRKMKLFHIHCPDLKNKH